MTLIICDPGDCERLIAQRRADGLDRYDEVWDGVYVMAPIASNEHQNLATLLASGFAVLLPRGHAQVFAGANVSDRDEGWTHNYRVPDVLVFLPSNPARDRGSHWQGGPDWAAEILSPGDRARQKFDFYAAVGVRELLLVDRDPWGLELHVNRAGVFELAEPIGDTLASTLFPLTFQLVPGATRPVIAMRHTETGATWTA